MIPFLSITLYCTIIWKFEERIAKSIYFEFIKLTFYCIHSYRFYHVYAIVLITKYIQSNAGDIAFTKANDFFQ